MKAALVASLLRDIVRSYRQAGVSKHLVARSQRGQAMFERVRGEPGQR